MRSGVTRVMSCGCWLTERLVSTYKTTPKGTQESFEFRSVMSAPDCRKAWETLSPRKGLINEDRSTKTTCAAWRSIRRPSRGGAMSVQQPSAPRGAVSPKEFATATLAHLTTRAVVAQETLNLVGPLIERFGAFAQDGLGVATVEGIESHHVEKFMAARRLDGSPATYSSRRNRRMALRLAFRAGRELGIVRGDPTLDVEVGVMASIQARPLTDDEIELGRTYAASSIRGMRRNIVWALAEATAQTGEMGFIQVRDVELPLGRVWIAGSAQREPRWGYFSEWGLNEVARRLEERTEPDESLIVWSRKPKGERDAKTLRSACTQAVSETLKAAGLRAPDVNPRSIVAWAGKKLLDEGSPIDEVARRLGMRSLDQAALFVGFDWDGERS